jgi:hypothetical protein
MKHGKTRIGRLVDPCFICVPSVAKRMSSPLLLSIALVGSAALCNAAESPIRAVADKDGKIIGFEGTGLSANALEGLDKTAPDDPYWPRLFAVYVGRKPGLPDVPPMLGSYSVHGSNVRFTPKFPLKPGLSYCVEYFPPPARDVDSPARYEQVFTIPAAPRGEAAKITAVYPSVDVLPENQLRFYVHFSAPMSRGEAYSHLQLLKENGGPVDLPFLEIGEELWDTSGQRLTLLIDPGRIKRGLKPREEAGPVLEAGHKYTLVITAGWRDESGQPVAADYVKKFSAGPPIEKAIEPKEWTITPPKAGSREPLAIRFPRPLDRALLERTIDVVDAAGKRLAGEVMVEDNERRWLFHPAQPWTAGKHELVIDTTLEDLAGNRIGRAFEVDELPPVEKFVATEFHRLPFEIPAAK